MGIILTVTPFIVVTNWVLDGVLIAVLGGLVIGVSIRKLGCSHTTR